MTDLICSPLAGILPHAAVLAGAPSRRPDGPPRTTDSAIRAADTLPEGADPLYVPADVRRLFDRMAPSYDRVHLALSFGLSALWRRSLLGLVPATGSPRRVLDLLSGRGETWAAIARRLPGAEITAVDFSARMTAQARSRNRRRFGEGVRVLQEDALAGTSEDASFDVVVSAYGLKTFDALQLERLAAEVARTLRPGGSFAFLDIAEPSCRPLRLAYRAYLRWMVPLACTLLRSDPAEYRMLHRYLAGFGDGSPAADAFRRTPGLHVEVQRHFFGCATSISGHRL